MLQVKIVSLHCSTSRWQQVTGNFFFFESSIQKIRYKNIDSYSNETNEVIDLFTQFEIIDLFTQLKNCSK